MRILCFFQQSYLLLGATPNFSVPRVAGISKLCWPNAIQQVQSHCHPKRARQEKCAQNDSHCTARNWGEVLPLASAYAPYKLPLIYLQTGRMCEQREDRRERVVNSHCVVVR